MKEKLGKMILDEMKQIEPEFSNAFKEAVLKGFPAYLKVCESGFEMANWHKKQRRLTKEYNDACEKALAEGKVPPDYLIYKAKGLDSPKPRGA